MADSPDRFPAVIETLGDRAPDDVRNLLAVWESSVRTTHDFLAEDDIVALRPEVEAAVRDIAILCVVRGDEDAIEAFMGVEDGMVEMLFVDAAARGRGIGGTLLRHAIDTLDARRVDVNEQNPQGVGFYRRFGFVVIGRDAVDSQGRPFPLLHMRYQAPEDL